MAHDKITLTKTTKQDLETLFEFQRDEEAIYLAAFTPKDPHDREAYLQKFEKLLQNPEVNMFTIQVDGVIAGSISKFIMEGDAEITYWIDKSYWGRGVASAALQNFLQLETTRPLFGRVAFDNLGSQKVLQKGGFIRIGEDRGFANARGTEIEEYIYRLAE